MATRSTVVAPPAPAADELPVVRDPLDDDYEELSVADRVQEALAQNVSDEARVSIWRIDPRTQKPEFCEEVIPSEFATAGFLESVRNKWGPGTYEARVYGAREGSKQRGLLTRPRFVIAAVRPGGALTPQQPGTQSSELATVLASIVEGQRAIADALNRQPDPSAAMRDSFALMRDMREAMGLGVAATPAPVAPAPSPFSTLKEAFELVDMVQSRTGSGAKEADEESMLGVALPIVKAVAAQFAGGGGASAVPPSTPLPPLHIPPSVGDHEAGALESADAGASMPAPLQLSATVNTEGTDMAKLPSLQELVMKGHIDKIMKMRESEQTPQTAGEYMADHLPAEVLPYLALPTWWDILTLHVAPREAARLEPHRAWLTEAVEHANALLDAAGDGEGEG